MTLFAAILTLAATATPAVPPGPVAVDGVEAIEHVPLPAVAGSLSLKVRALDATVALLPPAGSSQELIRAIRKAPRAVCPGLEVTGTEIRLLCRSSRIVARLAKRERGLLLEIGETRGLPWDGEDGPPLFAFDPPSVGFGEPCPGSTPAGRAECQLARGDRAGARATLATIDGAARAFADLRLGDLAFAAGDVLGAGEAWGRSQGQAWERLAAARLCELSWSCLNSPRAATVYDIQGLPPPLARDLMLRHARLLAFLGRPIEGARSLISSNAATVACAAAPSLCQRLVQAGLRTPAPDSVDALLLWLEMPDRGRGPLAYETAVAAAAAAERSGAPIFAANVLAAAAGQAPPRALGEHLLRTSELYLHGGDRVRASVVLEFARARSGKKGLRGPRWAAVMRAVSARAQRDAVTAPMQFADASDLIAVADRTAQAARALAGKGRP